MPESQAEVNKILFDRLDDHGKSIAALNTFKEVTQHQIKHSNERHETLGQQLAAQGAQQSEKLSMLSKMVSDLRDEKLLSDGAKSQWKFIAALIGTAYTLMQIVMVVKLFGGAE